jgi:hypothetical protein
MPYLFSYGTLQKEQVQLETFGRILQGEKDTLLGYQLDMIEITDPEVLRKAGKNTIRYCSFQEVAKIRWKEYFSK